MRLARYGFLLSALVVTSSCAHEAAPARAGTGASEGATSSTALEPRVLRGSDRPVLFTGTEPDAPVFGFIASDTVVQVSGQAQDGRVPVRIDGSVRVKAYVPELSLAVRVQKRGRVRGTPTYVGPNDLLRPLGSADAEGRVRVSVAPRVNGRELGPFEGTYPAAGLGAEKAPSDAQAPASGAAYVLPPGRPLALFEAPGGAPSMEIPAQALPMSVTVVAEEQGWLAVRVGDGPYVIGYTQDALSPEIEPPQSVKTPDAPDALPRLLRNESGALKRVIVDTQVTFNDQIVAVFKAQGWARVLAEYPEGQVDVFAAADDGPAVRGLVPRTALVDPSNGVRKDVFDDPPEAAPAGAAQ